MIDFRGFTPESFQQMAGLLSLQIFGDGVTIHGRGPDGGRDITFRGRVPYPFGEAQAWDGYGVVQVKFKSKLETTQQDQDWAHAQLRAELHLWLDSEKRSPKPDYYIFVTNVELTPASGGGRDRLDKLLAEYARKLGLRGYALWDANQLRALIEKHPLVRQRFTILFTPGDLLAALAKRLPQVPDADAILTNFLSSGLISDENARLGQAGDRSEDRRRLSSVFVDLPYSNSPNPSLRERGSKNAPPLCLDRLARVAGHKLDPQTLYEEEPPLANRTLSDLRRGDLDHSVCSRFLLVGGPGSGKSTIGQFLAQIHRAAILDRRPRHRLEPQVRVIIDALKARCADDLVSWPTTPRFVFRIELSAFAKALDADSADAASTFSEYLRRQLTRNTSISHETLRDWLQSFPWLIVLDGLDEVPAASNRRQVVAALQDFLRETRDMEADLLVVASTRPEGYDGEFEDSDMRTLYLSPLTDEAALQCAQRYVAAKIPIEDESRSREVLATIAEAIRAPLTGVLMRSPLQVTFMVTVIAASGKPSESRWQLLSDYYRIVYDRELHKAVPPFNRVLSKRRSVIDALHHQVGFLLQYRAEHSGGTQADLAIEEFESLVERLLREDGIEGEELVRERDEIVGAAKLRLVFLTTRIANRLTFDIRSLQEYMAAAYLTKGGIAQIMRRLDAIAHSAYWRNTLFFAVGRFFDDVNFRDDRDQLRLLCQDLNLKDDARASARLGSRLALEILENGGASAAPLVSRSLAASALQLLDLPVYGREHVARRLSRVYENAMEVEFKKVIATRLGLKALDGALNVWLTLLYLEERDVRWAGELADAHWPAETSAAQSILIALFDDNRTALHRNNVHPKHTARAEHLCANLSLVECWKLCSAEWSMWGIEPENSWLRHLLDWFAPNEFPWIPIEGLDSFGLQLNSLTQFSEPAATICDVTRNRRCHPDWTQFAPVLDFVRAPNAASLAIALRCLAESREPVETDFWLSISPWPLALYLASQPTKEALAKMARTVREDVGDIEEWKVAEQRWFEGRFTLDELFARYRPGLAALVDCSRYIVTESTLGPEDEPLVERLVEHLQDSPGSFARNSLWNAVCELSDRNYFGRSRSDVFQESLPSSNAHVMVSALIKNPPELELDEEAPLLDFYDRLGRHPKLDVACSLLTPDDRFYDLLLYAFRREPSRLGLLRLAAFWCALLHPSESSLKSLSSRQLAEPDYEWARQMLLMCNEQLSTAQAIELGRRFLATIPRSMTPEATLEASVIAVRLYARYIPELQAVLPALAELVTLPNCGRFAAEIEHLRYTCLQAQASGLDEARLQTLQLTV